MKAAGHDYGSDNWSQPEDTDDVDLDQSFQSVHSLRSDADSSVPQPSLNSSRLLRAYSAAVRQHQAEADDDDEDDDGASSSGSSYTAGDPRVQEREIDELQQASGCTSNRVTMSIVPAPAILQFQMWTLQC